VATSEATTTVTGIDVVQVTDDDNRKVDKTSKKIEPTPMETTSTNINTSTETKSKVIPKKYKLNPYVYHGGVDGVERRDKYTASLLCPTEPTDTNHGWDVPNLKYQNAHT
jgi:hypothetical protein